MSEFKPVVHYVNSLSVILEVDLRREKELASSSAVNQFVKDPNTVVYYGKLHAEVTMLDIGLRVTMDPREGNSKNGNWKNAQWARRTAVDALAADLSEDLLTQILKISHEEGRKIGMAQKAIEIRNALGIK